jgi:hypothetical protein
VALEGIGYYSYGLTTTTMVATTMVVVVVEEEECAQQGRRCALALREPYVLTYKRMQTTVEHAGILAPLGKPARLVLAPLLFALPDSLLLASPSASVPKGMVAYQSQEVAIQVASLFVLAVSSSIAQAPRRLAIVHAHQERPVLELWIR